MKVIYNTYIPFKGFTAINLFGILFMRKEKGKINRRILRHESIHTRQIIELLFFGFYIWYLAEWIIRWIYYKDAYAAYKNIGFEREAYENEDNPRYLRHRKPWQFRKYLKKSKNRNLK